MSEFENKSYFKIKGSTERNFGLVFATFFMIICLYPVLKGENIRFWALSISIILYCLGLFLPKTLIVPNKLWFKFGMILGAIVAPIVLGFIFKSISIGPLIFKIDLSFFINRFHPS